ncbi:MAG: protoporphyrinogen oxidase [Polyangiaceae bacterium]|nr:protoporphyrinogen oxidase [Polyangiaceae bacterium]
MAHKKIVIVGGGITGLAAAYQLLKSGTDADVTLVEASDRVGGIVQTEHVEGFVIERGPDSFLKTKLHARQLAVELGLEPQFISPRSHRLYFVHKSRLESLPPGMVLGIPTRAKGAWNTPLLSKKGVLRALAEPVVPVRRGNGDESVLEFLSRRLGREAATRIAAPLLSGVFAGDAAELSIQSTFPQLIELEKNYGSLLGGLFAQRSGIVGEANALTRAAQILSWMMRDEDVADSPFVSLAGGMGGLVDAIVDALPPEWIQTNCQAHSVLPAKSGGWTVATEGAGVLEADAVLLTTPARVSQRILPAGALREELGQIPFRSTVIVTFALESEGLGHDLNGVGFVAPDRDRRLIAGTFSSSKWSGRAPRGKVLLRAYLCEYPQGSRLCDASDATLVGWAQAGLLKLFGRVGQPLFTRVVRYRQASPQPVVGHQQRMAGIDRELENFPGVYLAGAGLRGVGLPDCIRQGREAGRRILADLG